jgi:hypothetical protein
MSVSLVAVVLEVNSADLGTARLQMAFLLVGMSSVR